MTQKTMNLKLADGEVVKLEMSRTAVRLTNKHGEWVSFCPSMKSAGVSTVDCSSVLMETWGEVENKFTEQFKQAV